MKFMRTSTIGLLGVLLVTACGSRTPLLLDPFEDDPSGGGAGGGGDDDDAGGDGSSRRDASSDRSVDVRADGDTGADTADARDARDALDAADVPDIPDVNCFAEVREGKGIPIDFYFLADRSTSMNMAAGMTTRWTAMSRALSNFVNSPSSAGLGAGVNFFPKSVAGSNAASCAVSTYAMPNVPVGLLPDVAPAITAALAAQTLSSSTPTTPALEASLAYARARKMSLITRDLALVLVTDGAPNGCSSSIATSTAVISSYANGSPPVKTYVLGIGPNLTNLHALAQAGGTGQARLIETGGEAELTAAFNAIRANSITCDYMIPMPPGPPIDFTLVNVQVRVGIDGQVTPLTKVNNAAACTVAGGWYYDNPVPPGIPTPTRISLCPTSCGPLMQTAGSHLNILVGCKTATGVP